MAMQVSDILRATTDMDVQAAIHRLPNELLSIILLLVKNETIAEAQSSNKQRPRPRQSFRWLPLSLVCRHWRKVALATKTLWTSLEVEEHTLEWYNLAIARAQNAPLDIRFMHAHLAVAAFPSLAPLSACICRLAIADDNPTLVSILDIMALNMPSLVELELVNKKPSLENVIPSRKLAFSQNQFPSLRILRVSHVMFTETSAFENLQVLDLRMCSFEGDPLSWPQFLKFLDKCHALEELRLYRILSTALINPPNSSFPTTASPSKFRKLVLHDKPTHVTRFLSHYTFPPDMTLRLTAWDTGPIRDTPVVTPMLERLLPIGRHRIVDMGRITRAEVDNLLESVKVRGWELADERSRSDPLVALKLPGYLFGVENLWYDALRHALVAFTRLFARAPLRTLNINGGFNGVSTRLWVRVFEAFPTLEVLNCFGHDPFDAFLCALGQPRLMTALTELAQAEPVLPRLRELSLTGLEWREGVLEALVGVLERRELRNLPRLEDLSVSMDVQGDVNEYRRSKALFLHQVSRRVGSVSCSRYS